MSGPISTGLTPGLAMRTPNAPPCFRTCKITAATAAIVATAAITASAVRAALDATGGLSACQRKSASRRAGPGRLPLLPSSATFSWA